MELGEIIRQKRKSLGWSQAKLAEKADIEAAQISKYECGRVMPALESARKIADAFGIELSELLDDKPKKRKMPPGVREKCGALQKLFDELMRTIYDGD